MCSTLKDTDNTDRVCSAILPNKSFVLKLTFPLADKSEGH